MSATQPDGRYLLSRESTDLSGFSSSPTLVSRGTPQSPPGHHPGYARLNSAGPIHDPLPEEDIADTFNDHFHGLGIATSSTGAGPLPSQGPRASLGRVPVGSKSPSIKGGLSAATTPGSHSVKSPRFDDNPQYVEAPDYYLQNAAQDSDHEHNHSSHHHQLFPSVSSLQSFTHRPYTHADDTVRLAGGGPPSVRSTRSAYDADFSPREACPTQKKFYQGRGNWLAISIYVLSLYSTIFSGIYFFLAAKGPRYGSMISSHATLTPGGAIILTSVIAKTIELSFVTAFVSFLGQVLSRRAFMRDHGRGVTLAEMSMRSWIMQPGTLITHWHAVRYAGLTLLGALSLLAALVATLYTAASSALVQPQLRFGDWEPKLMMGEVKTSFANPIYLANNCETPVKNDFDTQGNNVAGSTCLQIEHASQGYHNYQRYIAQWSEIAGRGEGASRMEDRPRGFGQMRDNVTISAQWIEIADVDEAYKKYGRIVNNVSLALPHAGVVAAAELSKNRIIQPSDLDGQGIYSLHASVPSPVMHVLCANLEREELAPLIYSEWPNANKDTAQVDLLWPGIAETPMNKTKVDEIFGWSDDWDPQISDPNEQPRPVFAKFPNEYNTMLNHSAVWGTKSLYLLGRSPASKGEIYNLCSLRASQTPFCSTRYNASGSSGVLESICEDHHDSMQYHKSLTNSSAGWATLSPDWVNIASEWGNSLSLNAGFFGGNASNARLLTQLTLAQPKLDVALPSPAEALSVMASCTLLMSTADAPFVPFYNYSATSLTEPQIQYFNASIRAQEYASGGAQAADRGFFIVLFAVFILNIWVLLYFILHNGLVTDFSEPPNMFSIAVNSPPSHLLAGSCGGGPHGKQYDVNWFLSTEGDHLYMEAGDKKDKKLGMFGFKRKSMQPSTSIELNHNSPVGAMYSKLANRRSFH